MRRTIIIIGALIATVAFPAAASAHHVDSAESSADCDSATIRFEGFSSYDLAYGITIKVYVDGVQVASDHLSDAEFDGYNHTHTVAFPKIADAKAHTVTVKATWKTGSGQFSRTVSECCPPPPVCCVDGEPGPPGPAGPAGPAGPPGPPSQNTTTVIERTVVQVVESTCTSKRVYRFLVKRWHRIEKPGERLRLVTAVRASENGFGVTVRKVRRDGKRRWQVTVRPPKGGKKVARGQVFVTNVSVRLKGKGKRWFALSEKRRLCMPSNGNLNAPDASGPSAG